MAKAPRPGTRDAPDFSLPDAGWMQRLRRRLLAWYRREARDLPWRQTRDPYAIWISEVMLQQTQVSTVCSYYSRFLDEFPDVRSLAGADHQRVLRVWEGLGYYRRVRHLHLAAKQIVQHHGGQFPQDADAARSLPGVGRYTAGAVLSIAFDARQPVLEANTLRALTRLLAYDRDPRRAEGQRLLWNFAEQLLPRRNAGVMNQALMELGSEVCQPRRPLCGGCPVRLLCAARRNGQEEKLPVAKKPLRYEAIREVAVVIRHRGRVLLRRCGQGERWEGLWDFPRFRAEQEGDAKRREQMVREVRDRTGLTVQIGPRWTTIHHGVTRYRITLDCYQARVVSGRRLRGVVQTRWVRPGDFEAFPLNVSGRKIGRLLAGSPD